MIIEDQQPTEAQAPTMAAIYERLRNEMDIIQADLVRQWRIEQRKTWSEIAQLWKQLYTGWTGEHALGYALCRRAARMHNELPDQEPWS